MPLQMGGEAAAESWTLPCAAVAARSHPRCETSTVGEKTQPTSSVATDAVSCRQQLVMETLAAAVVTRKTAATMKTMAAVVDTRAVAVLPRSVSHRHRTQAAAASPSETRSRLLLSGCGLQPVAMAH